MYLLLGNSHMESSDYKGAIHSFERAQAQIRNHAEPRLVTISLVGFLMGVLRRIEIAH
jgi:hypothetical protein